MGISNLRALYWYRFIDKAGNASRTGRTLTAPADDDPRPVRFAVVSCQNANIGEQHAYRRMIHEDERAPRRSGSALCCTSAISSMRLSGIPKSGRRVCLGAACATSVRYPQGEKIADYHVPTGVEDYRAIYRAYLHDPHLQDARARWPFVCMWDNHEFSIAGWQSMASFDGKQRPAQTLKVAANQAWFEYQPSRAVKSSGPDLAQFRAPQVKDASLETFDAHGFADEFNNRVAVGSLTGYRALRWGRNVELRSRISAVTAPGTSLAVPRPKIS